MKSFRMTTLALGAAFVALAAEPVNDWENPAVNSINREPARAYSMPLADEKAALTDDLEPATPYVRSLNGTWKISWCGEPSQRVRDFWKTDYDDANWFTIDVPSCVELRGFGSPGYTNVKYPHANMAPLIRDRADGKSAYNPVSSYRRTFTVPADWAGRDVFLRFDGVYSAYYVWVNGKKVGYAEDSKLPSEFKITSFLKPGENLLAVEVYRWCDGSYLEDQDMFRYSGIYRDVTLFAAPKVRLDNFFVRETFSPDYKNATLALTTVVRGGTAPVTAKLFDAAFKQVGPDFKDRLDVTNVHLWSAEDPYLYTLVVKAGDDVRACRVGFKEVKIVGNAVLVNGQKIKFKGVDRHECSVNNGRSISRDEMITDVTLFKRYNINTVRTSHYPNHHTWYDLCDRYGIYVCAEANVEGHEPGYSPKGLGHDPRFFDTIVERNVNNVKNYRNHPAIVFWSMGNETSHGDGFRKAIAAVKALDGSRLIHWERGNKDADVDSTMYPTVEWLEQRGKLGDEKPGAPDMAEKYKTLASSHSAGKPFFMCEYAHAMGNAVGNFAEYWDVFYRYDSLSGGCIWDWVDQAIWKDTDRIGPDGKRVRVLAYGGDFDEQPNDGPFCCNGVVDPFRNISPKLLEIAHVHRNIVVSSPDAATGKAELWNRFGFTHVTDFEARWELVRNGRRVDGGIWHNVPDVPPLSRKTVDLPKPSVPTDATSEYFLNVEFRLRKDTLWAKAGWVIARDQLPFRPRAFHAAEATCAAAKAVKPVVVSANAQRVKVEAGGTRAVFCRKTGTLCSLEMNGRRILKDVDGIPSGPQLTVERAFTDNDRWLRDGNPWSHDAAKSFYDTGLTQLRYHARPFATRFDSDGSFVLTATVEVTSSKSAAFTHTAVWTFFPCGKVTVSNTADPRGRMPCALPRLGTTWRLDKSLEQVSYYGRGPEENYVDRFTGSFLGVWKNTVTGMYVPYVRPQDCGYRSDVRWIALTDGDGRGVKFSADVPLFAQALHFGCEDLEFARHRNGQQRIFNMPVPRAEVMLNLDVRQLGLGGASCGPRPMDKYIFPVEKTHWTLTLEPVGARKKFLGLF